MPRGVRTPLSPRPVVPTARPPANREFRLFHGKLVYWVVLLFSRGGLFVAGVLVRALVGV
jgi:hypothetical protein